MSSSIFRTTCAIVAAALLFSAPGCSSDDEHTHSPEPMGTVTFHIDNDVDGDPVQLNQLIYTNSTGTKYSVVTLRYLISDVLLHATSGEVYGLGDVHFRDQSDDATRSFSIDGVPAGTYDMVSFTFGLDEFKNVRDKYLNEPWHAAMVWPGPLGYDQGLGYHYMQLEGNFEDTPGGNTIGYTTHTGARLCDGTCGPLGEVHDPVAQHHFFRVYLPVAKTVIDGDNWVVTLNVNINGWYTDHTPTDNFDSAYDWHNLPMQMIMANTAAQNMLQANGPGCFSASIAAAQ